MPAYAHAHERLNLLWIAVYLCGGVLALRLGQIQILEGVEYSLAAERNRTQMIYQTAPRGRIFDRNGAAVATNQPAFSLIYMPAKNRKTEGLKALAQDLARELKLNDEELLETLEQAVREQTVVRLAENLPTRAMFRLSELKTIYPGVNIIEEARRYYPFGRFASHLLGFMGKMDPKSWRELKTKGYRVDSRIGRLGLEGVFEKELRGEDGGIQMEVDVQGRLKRILERVPWQAGSNIHLTIDAAIQKAADDGLRRSPTGRGAAIALDPRSGAILALSSAPDFDPNAFLSSDPEVVKESVTTLPEFNHAISGTYPPGSAFKLIVGAAGLNEGRIITGETVFCPGYFELGSQIFMCWEHKGHKKVDWFSGLANSCDVYFYRMGLKTGGALIERYERLFGLGAKTNVVLRGEKKGNVFGPAARAGRSRSWYDGDTVNLAIGQGELLVTPIQMAVMVAAVANRGTLWRPHYTDRIEYTQGRPEYKQKTEKMGQIAMKSQAWDSLYAAMSMVVSSGTAKGAVIPGLEVFGKTGTAQNPGPDHAWFVSFARRPGEAASVAVAVIVENGGHGGTTALPIAREMFLAAFGMQEKTKPVLPLPAGPRELVPGAGTPVRSL